jgi:hypothetical protein
LLRWIQTADHHNLVDHSRDMVVGKRLELFNAQDVSKEPEYLLVGELNVFRVLLLQ